jgi:hypothetical protein
MGIGLFLLLPESKRQMDEYADYYIDNKSLKEMPYSFFLAFFAYSFMLLIEKVVFNSQTLIPFLNEGAGGHGHGHAHDDEIKAEPQLGEEEDPDEEEEAFKNAVSTRGKYASFMQLRNCMI